MFKKWVIIILVVSSFFLGKYIEKKGNTVEFSENSIHMERTGTGYLINPLLECELSTFGSNQKYIPFENETKNRIQNEIISKNPNIEFSLYFRNLRNGPWFGINENADFSPASLMKLPIAIAYMKWSEFMPEILNASITGVLDSANVQNIVPNQSIVVGKPYKIIDLIGYSLAYSDNNANETLVKNLPKDLVYKVFSDLSLPVLGKLEAGEDEYISVKEYAAFFRILYNASYLSDIESSYLLEIMTKSSLSGAIRGSIPDDIVVAHKFGERRLENSDGSYTAQFHDCGIVYYPNYPYIICIMSKGRDNIPFLENIVKDTSSIIFDEIKKRY